MDVFLTSDGLLALMTLAALAIVLGVDNLVFIAIVSGLALAFLILIGVVLVADGLGQRVPRGYIYSSMAFSLSVELLNMRYRRRSRRRGRG